MRTVGTMLLGFALLSGSASAGSATDATMLKALLAKTPGLAKSTNPHPQSPYPWYKLGSFEGMINLDNYAQGTIATGQTVVAIPMFSDGTLPAVHSLLYAGTSGALHFVGYVPIRGGRVEIEHGLIAVVTPVYAPNDQGCCPSTSRVEYDTLDGIKLVHVRNAVVKNPPP